MAQEVCSLKAQLEEKEKEISALKKKLAQLEKKSHGPEVALSNKVETLSPLTAKPRLSNEDIMRYSRQLLLPELGVKGQLNLCKTSVLIVGCGGLGCPLAQYLAAAGIGRLGLLDYDEVELSNLHRQVLHGEEDQGQVKALSAAGSIKRGRCFGAFPSNSEPSVFCTHVAELQPHGGIISSNNKKMLNSTVECIPYHLQLTPENALQLIQQYDIVADCSDNVPTRYLVNDACVISGKPLVSASALRMEGQLTVYNYKGGPCYRCLYPVPPPPETVTNCSDGGVLGVVPGIMGCFQALEVLKIASGQGSSCSQHLLMFDAQDLRFRSIRLRPKQAGCAVCGENPSVTRLIDYEAFCGSAATDKCRKLNLLSSDQRITVQEYKSIVDNSSPHILLDVRPLVEVEICNIPFSLNIPLSSLEDRKSEDIQLLQERISQLKQQMAGDSQPAGTEAQSGQGLMGLLGDPFFQIYVLCKQGNDSQKAVQVLEKMSGSEVDTVSVKDICGGLVAWALKIDTTFPQY